MGSIEVQVIRIATPFSTTEQFVGTFKNYITEDSCFIPSTQMRTVGLETGFSIRLADGTPVLRGLGVVLDSWSTDENPWRKPGIRLGLRKLTKETKSVFDELQHARLARGSGHFGPTTEDRVENPQPIRMPRAESISDGPASIDAPENTNAPIVISFFQANNDSDDDVPASSGRPTRSMRVVEADRVMTTDTHANAVPMVISEEHENATERMEMTDLPVRADVATLLGFAPLAKPRASTERDRDTTLGMAPLERDPVVTATVEPGIAAIGPISIESIAATRASLARRPRVTTPMPTQAPTAAPDVAYFDATIPETAPIGSMPLVAQAAELPRAARVVSLPGLSLPGLASLHDLPELAALSMLETTAIVERPQRRGFRQWVSRLVWRVRAWYRTRSMR